MESDDRPENVLQLVVPGATKEQIAAGLAAAVEVLNYAGLHPAVAFSAYEARTAWRRGMGPALPDIQLQFAACFTVAQLAAFDHAIGVDTPRPEGSRLFVGALLH